MGLAYVTKANVLDQRGIQGRSLLDLLQQGVDHVLEGGVLEATLLCLGQWRPDSQGDDYVVGIFGSAVRKDEKVSVSVRFSCTRGPVHSARGTHIEARELPGVKCLRMEPSRSTAMIDVLYA